MTYKPGPRELQLRALRERNYQRMRAKPKATVGELRDKVASVKPKPRKGPKKNVRKPKK